MLLKKATKKLHNSSFLNALTYRIPLPVKEILVFPNGYSYPVCPRCDISMDKEYTGFCDRCGQRLGWKSFDTASVVCVPRR